MRYRVFLGSVLIVLAFSAPARTRAEIVYLKCMSQKVADYSTLVTFDTTRHLVKRSFGNPPLNTGTPQPYKAQYLLMTAAAHGWRKADIGLDRVTWREPYVAAPGYQLWELDRYTGELRMQQSDDPTWNGMGLCTKEKRKF